MKNRKLKLLAFTCVLALGLPTASIVHAQQNVPVTLTTTSAITVAAGNDVDYGEWLLLLTNDDVNNTLVMSAVDGTITPGNDPGVDTTDDSTRFLINAGTGRGTIDVTTPASATVNIYADVNDFTEASLTLSAPTFSVNGGASATLSEISGTPSTYTSSNGTADTIGFGATITATATPPDAVQAGASLDVFVSY